MSQAIPDAPPVLRYDDGVATLPLNQPRARNALSHCMLCALLGAFAEIAADDSVRLVILAGAGPVFCAGHDLKEIRAAEYGRDYY